ncbi:unnamed protein product, partial [Owenia fusiformis]
GDMDIGDFDNKNKYHWYGKGATVTHTDGLQGKGALVSDMTKKNAIFGQVFTGDEVPHGGMYYMEGHVKIINHPKGSDWFEMNMKYGYKNAKQNKNKFSVVNGYPRLRSDDGWVKIAGEFELPSNCTQLMVLFQSKDKNLEFAVDEVSLKQIIPVADWEIAANEMIHENRKGNVKLSVNITYNLDPSFVGFEVRQLSHDFKLGVYVAEKIINASNNYAPDFKDRYRDYVYDNFNSATPALRFRWSKVEPTQDELDWKNSDPAMYTLKENGMNIYGQPVFENDDRRWPRWVKNMDSEELVKAMNKRANDLIGRYKGSVDQWVVCEDTLSRKGDFETYTKNPDILTKMFDFARAADEDATLLLSNNDVVRMSYLSSAMVHQINRLKDAGHSPHIDVQCQFDDDYPVEPIKIMTRLNILAEADVPIWVSQLHVQRDDVIKRADDLENFLRVAFAHPKVEGITLNGFWDEKVVQPDTSLVDTNEFNKNEAGWTVSRLFEKEWRTDGYVTLPELFKRVQSTDFRAFYGDYEMDVIVDGEVVETRGFSVHKDVSTEVNVKIDNPKHGDSVAKRSVYSADMDQFNALL